jgi:hypothetical protein
VLDCQVAKLTAAGNRAKCLAKEETDLLKGRSYTPQQCEADFDTAIAAADIAAAAAGSPCRYISNTNGTVSDLNTLLQWEKKDTTVNSAQDYNNPRDVDNTYQWSSTGTAPDGSLFTDFLAKLNNLTTISANSIPGGFAGHSDWRVPNHVELQTILNCSNSPCIAPIFGPTQASGYWSSTTNANFPFDAWFVFFFDGFVGDDSRDNFYFARAVRGGR